MDDCLFCKIVKGEIPSVKVYEDDDVLALLDIAPATPKKGHVLVIPKKHYERIVDMPTEQISYLFSAARNISFALMKEADGVNLMQNNGKVAGQLVDHVHVHLVPRFDGDGVELGKWHCYEYSPGEMAKYQEKIKKLLNDG